VQHALTELKLTAVTKPADDPAHEIRADVCVVGAGIAGLSAAIESAQLGPAPRWAPPPRTRWTLRAAAAPTTSTWTGYTTGWRRISARLPRSRAGEARLALVGEGLEPLREVARAGHLPLHLSLQLKLLVHPLVEPAVELSLGSRI
jgi:glycine/D-amino acid oxidase-like deaminating enzyme